MNTLSRFTLIGLVLTVCTILVWPNIGERVINLSAQPELPIKKQVEVLESLQTYLNKNYPNKYKSKINKENHQIEIVGSFIQTAFLNELAQFKGIDSDSINLQKTWAEEHLFAKRFKLGLDLQGGINLVLQGNFEEMKNKLQKTYSDEFVADLKDQLEKEEDSDKKNQIEAKLNFIKESMVFDDARKRRDMLGALEIIRSRIDKTGVSEPLIRLQGNDRIEVSLPGVASPEKAKRQIASTAKVEYRLAEPMQDANNRTLGFYTEKATAFFEEFSNLKSEREREMFLKMVAKKIKLPYRYELVPYYSKSEKQQSTRNKGNSYIPVQFLILEREVAMSGEAMSRNVYDDFDPQVAEHKVVFELTSEGRETFARITSENKGRQLAILIDGRVVSYPRINSPILGGRGEISGNFTRQEAQDLSLIIREGALPVPMRIVEERTVGPTLGQESINLGVYAISVGLALVAIFMLFYYEVAGFISIIALMANVLLMAGIFALMDFTITLPGLAGVVLTLGMAVDANVIIYERIREELRKGKSLKLALEQGFERATYTILDANITTMVAAIVLASKLSSGPIKGFGVTLFVGILTSLFTSLYITKTIVYQIVFGFNLSRLPIGRGKFIKRGLA